MKRLILCLTICLGLLLVLSGCGTNDESTSNDKTITGVWTNEDPQSQDATNIITLDVSSDTDYELQITRNILEDNLQNTTTIVNGTYEDDGSELKLKVDKVEGNQSNDSIKSGDTLTLGYTLAGDSEKLTITGLEKSFPDLPESIDLSRNNDSN